MKYIISAILFTILFSCVASANANFDVKRMKELHKSKIQMMEDKQAESKLKNEINKTQDKSKDEKSNKEVKKNELPKSLTNYQYDDVKYKNNRINKYIQSNIDYSKSGQYVRFN